jgi:alpha-amylase
VTPRDFIEARFEQLARALDEPYALEALRHDGLDARLDVPFADGTLGVRKSVALGGGRLDPTLDVSVTIENRSGRALQGRVGIEWSVMLLGGGGNPAAYYLVEGVRTAHDSTGQATATRSLESGNEYVGVRLTTELEPAGDAWWAPIETISNSEAGFERVYQGSSLLLSWPVSIEPGETWRGAVRQCVEVTRDHAAEEERW